MVVDVVAVTGVVVIVDVETTVVVGPVVGVTDVVVTLPPPLTSAAVAGPLSRVGCAASSAAARSTATASALRPRARIEHGHVARRARRGGRPVRARRR